MAENPQNIIRSWNVQTNFAGGPVTYNKLVPPPYGRIMWNYVQTWREVSAGLGDLDWGAKYFSFYLPKAVRVLGAMYLRIQLPAAKRDLQAVPRPVRDQGDPTVVRR